MTQLPPPQPEFGAPLPVGAGDEAVLKFLALRRSSSAATLVAPAPSKAELSALLRLAARVPDHGKLAPWRFVVLEGAAKLAFVERLDAIAGDRPDAEKAHAALIKIKTPPMSVVVVSRHIEAAIPEWEQRLSAGAVCLTLVNAAQAMGYGANWITDWYAYDDQARALLGLAPGELVAGYVHLGSPSEAPLERVRPDVEAITTRWAP